MITKVTGMELFILAAAMIIILAAGTVYIVYDLFRQMWRRKK